MSSPNPWAGLAVAISTDRALLGPEAAGLVLALIAGAERVARRDGIPLSPQLRHLREVLRPVAANGHADVPSSPDLPISEEVFGIADAARLLRRSIRQTRRMAASGNLGPTRRTGRAWLVSRAEVEAYAAALREESA